MIETADKLLELAQSVIDTEVHALTAMRQRIGPEFQKACTLIQTCKGRVVVIGIGKSGHIGRKIAATFASTGTPAFFVHPAEANHGDMGMITQQDIVMAISNSGETPEILSLLSLILRQKIPLISLCGRHPSTLSSASTIVLDTSIDKEACPLGLAPTASTTCTLVMGDALAIALLHAKGFTANDFAKFHPGGALGRRLLLRVDDLMHIGDKLPLTYSGSTLQTTLLEMTRKRFGMTGIINTDRHLIGVYTDGDLRRTLEQGANLNSCIDSLMTRNCRIIEPGLFAVEALRIMEEHKITSLFITNKHHHPIGIIHMHDLLENGVV
ncbi:MAG: D-arabinose 5-phosphate isomerase [Gammaproteobacteria bacterium RIFCSPHIGHO2_12_FULL_41_15]|nr:MAG: D-arabinose 5-phosphate isomerase [Gammaproteobacteria bacterium RIFCSPHIGHO2_12_FULL_41_15]